MVALICTRNVYVYELPYAATTLSVVVTVERRVDLPTDGNPIRATRASPDFITSKPSPLAPDLPVGSKS